MRGGIFFYFFLCYDVKRKEVLFLERGEKNQDYKNTSIEFQKRKFIFISYCHYYSLSCIYFSAVDVKEKYRADNYHDTD